MEAVHLDTHAAVWLYAGESGLFTPRVRALIDSAEVFISPMVLLELQMLRETGRISIKVDTFLRDMHSELGLKLCDDPFVSVALEAVKVSWTRDPFDRMIVAQAALNEARLITRDRLILEHYRRATWQ
jgi:PIN domain nuclease of toxin-antitoxin system